MSIWRYGLAILGSCIAGLPGGFFGYFAGAAIDAKKDKGGEARKSLSDGGVNPDWKQYAQRLNDADIALTVLVAAVLKADGQVRRSELDAVKRFLVKNYDEEEGKQVLTLLRELVKPLVTIDVAGACDIVRQHADYTTRYHMTDFLFLLALADGEFHGEENKTIQNIARHLRITQSDYTSMFTRHTRGSSGRQYSYSSNRQNSYSSSTRYSAPKSDPYKVLGLESSATDEEVKKAYRRMAMRYHPDKVEGLGEEMKKNATEQFRTINEAYETIKRERNIK